MYDQSIGHYNYDEPVIVRQWSALQNTIINNQKSSEIYGFISLGATINSLMGMRENAFFYVEI